MRSDELAPGASDDAAGGESIENEYFRLNPSPRGFEIDDLKNHKTVEVHFEDDCDRDDEHNFDPVAEVGAKSGRWCRSRLA